jgi:DNA invertase Pin-like site-specific DNA recombinase
MTAVKSKQVARMVAAGTPLTEVAEVLGVSRTTLYRHLKTTSLRSPGPLKTPRR